MRDQPRIADQDAVFKPGVVADEVGDDAREGKRVIGVVKARFESFMRRPARSRRLPCAPLEGCAAALLGLGIAQPRGVAVDDVALPITDRNGGKEAVPLCGKL